MVAHQQQWLLLYITHVQLLHAHIHTPPTQSVYTYTHPNPPCIIPPPHTNPTLHTKTPTQPPSTPTPSYRSTNSATFSKSLSTNPLLVSAGVPIRTPPGTRADTSPGTVFLLAAMCASSRTRSTRLPSTPLGRRSTRRRWLTVPGVCGGLWGFVGGVVGTWWCGEGVVVRMGGVVRYWATHHPA